MIRDCKHPIHAQTIVVVSANCGCETTRIQCGECEEFISDPKTDC